jgi:magnesium-transporting ATPase (P-type)
MQNLDLKIECDLPNVKLYEFNGKITVNGENTSVSNDQVVLRGCILRNTTSAVCAVVYTGHESKIMKNSKKTRLKMTYLERTINTKLFTVFGIIFVCALVCTIIGHIFETSNINTGKHWYFFRNETNKRNTAYLFFILLISHIVIINAMIPISLYVTLELVRVLQAFFVKWDKNMYDEESQTGANAKTTTISDDLGKINYIFSDKTGTLTRNVMEFMQCSIGGKKYGKGVTEIAYAAAKRQGLEIEPPDPKGKAFKDDEFLSLLEHDTPEEIRDFLWLLSTCHAVIPKEDSTKPHGVLYQANSPDEVALVQAAADFGFAFGQRSQGQLIVLRGDEKVPIPIFANLEFSSERKRSSVII